MIDAKAWVAIAALAVMVLIQVIAFTVFLARLAVKVDVANKQLQAIQAELAIARNWEISSREVIAVMREKQVSLERDLDGLGNRFRECQHHHKVPA